MNTDKDVLIFLGLMDFEAALKINPKADDLKTEAENLRKIIESADSLKDYSEIYSTSQDF